MIMIRTKDDLKYYLNADAIALRKYGKCPLLSRDDIWKFQRLLRKTEYLKNTIRTKISFKYIRFRFLSFKLSRLGRLLGFSIPLNTCGPGLSIAHRGTLVINDGVRLGANVRLHVCVNIGTNAGSKLSPMIGNNVYIGPGAKIFGDIHIADGIAIGANSVVNKSFLERNISIAGIPARKISDKGSKNLVRRATDILDRLKRIQELRT